MELKDIILNAQYKIIEGTTFQWKCYGKNARYLDFEDVLLSVSASCIFDCHNQTVYEACLYIKEKAYRWLNPQFSQLMYDESFTKNIDPRVYLDESIYTDCEVESDFLEKLQEAFLTGTCNSSITVNLDWDEAIKGHEEFINNLLKTMTPQEIVIEALEDAIKENHQMWQKLTDEIKTIEIKVDLNAPINCSNYEFIKNEILKSGKDALNLAYSNKLTAQGLEHYLKDEDFTIQYE